jgi:hypothetical protein
MVADTLLGALVVRELRKAWKLALHSFLMRSWQESHSATVGCTGTWDDGHDVDDTLAWMRERLSDAIPGLALEYGSDGRDADVFVATFARPSEAIICENLGVSALDPSPYVASITYHRVPHNVNVKFDVAPGPQHAPGNKLFFSHFSEPLPIPIASFGMDKSAVDAPPYVRVVDAAGRLLAAGNVALVPAV